QIIEKTGQGQPMLSRMAEMFVARLQDEQDADVVSRLAGALALIVDMWLRSGDLGVALDLMRKSERLAASGAPAARRGGEKLSEALARAGSEKMFKKLTEMLLEGSDQSSMQAAEILKRGGDRTAHYLIERLAEEENRSHRARLVALLKEMGKGTSRPFIARLEDARWFLVRNVVGILGDIGDPAVLPDLARVASHNDPRVRREVIRTVTRFGGAESEELVVSALQDEDRGVQMTAVNALATLKTKRSIGVLASLARKSGSYQNAPAEVRQEALICLGRLGTPEAFPILKEILTRKGFLGHSEPTETRVSAAKALGSVATAEARTLLSELAAKDSRQAVREAAKEALHELATPSVGQTS
ncbi:MAG TPA: HEAT repeat domain-containing protein, partial [Candidatus Polarisedimenticolia bacterium]|nr:HEAT repeat domain-containing protein [Candidatus Polarisedimenticolia bacterium]